MTRYTIKPLDWKPVFESERILRAETVVGVTYHAFAACIAGGGQSVGAEWTASRPHIAGAQRNAVESMEAAKAAAEQDYIKLISVALEESPDEAELFRRIEAGEK